MSTEMKSGVPDSAATMHAPITPPAGPLASVAMGRFSADTAVAMPPFDCITSNSCRYPCSFNCSSSRRTYR